MKSKTEIHSSEYSRVRSKCSSNVAIVYANDQGEEILFGVVEKFLKFTHQESVHKVALVTVYESNTPTTRGTQRIKINKPYKTGKIVSIACIDRKVVFFKLTPNDVRILDVPLHLSK